MKDFLWQLFVLLRSFLLVVLTCGVAILFSVGLVATFNLVKPLFASLLAFAFVVGLAYMVKTMKSMRGFE